ncbi:MAG: hypothetical protein R3F53_26465 [Gammaproteobacteria bacterium]
MGEHYYRFQTPLKKGFDDIDNVSVLTDIAQAYLQEPATQQRLREIVGGLIIYQHR